MSQKTFQIKAPAKVNLFLHVIGKLPNNYHNLCSLVCFTENLYDVITIQPHLNFKLTTNKPSQMTEPNLIEKVFFVAADYLNIHKEERNLHIHLTKNIPIAAGLGGGSSDAAAILHLLSKLWKFNLKAVMPLLPSLGADIPIAICKHSAFFYGTGEIISKKINLPPLYLLLVNPMEKLLTSEVFQNNQKYSASVEPIFTFSNLKTLLKLLNITHNDLEESAINLLPIISEVKSVIAEQEDCKLARMTGSGPTCFGIFSTKRAALSAYNKISTLYPNWWLAVTSIDT